MAVGPVAFRLHRFADSALLTDKQSFQIGGTPKPLTVFWKKLTSVHTLTSYQVQWHRSVHRKYIDVGSGQSQKITTHFPKICYTCGGTARPRERNLKTSYSGSLPQSVV